MGLYSLGANGMGQLGLGHCDDKSEVKKVQLPSSFLGAPSVMVCGGNHALIMDSRGKVFASGNNRKGQLFLPEAVSQSEFFAELENNCESVVDLGAGFEHSCYITRNKVFSKGSNSFCQLGCTGPTSCYELDLGATLSAVECGPRTVCILAESGEVWCWGKGQLPIKLEVPPAIKVKQGFHHTCILTKEGQVFTVGKNNYGQRGSCAQSSITQVLGIDGIVIDIQSGWYHCLALTQSGDVWGWGRNDHHQLDANSGHTFLPRLLTLPSPAVQIACGAEHSVALTKDFSVYAWGWNEHGNCGQSSMTEPLDLPSKATQIAAGYGFTLVWCQS